MRTFAAFVLCAVGLLAPSGPAAAEETRLGFNVVPMPFGSIETSAGGMGFSRDTAFAFGVLPILDYQVHPNFFIGIGPQYILNVKGQNDAASAKELDIMLRLGGGAPVTDTVQLYGYLSPGYSILWLPSTAANAGIDNPKGLVLGFHGGGIVDIDANLFVNVEIGYQLGFQKVSVAGTDADLKSSFFQIGLGAGLRL